MAFLQMRKIVRAQRLCGGRGLYGDGWCVLHALLLVQNRFRLMGLLQGVRRWVMVPLMLHLFVAFWLPMGWWQCRPLLTLLGWSLALLLLSSVIKKPTLSP